MRINIRASILFKIHTLWCGCTQQGGGYRLSIERMYSDFEFYCTEEQFQRGSCSSLFSGPTDLTSTAKRFPTVLSTFGGDSEALGLSLTRLLAMFRWKRLAVLRDNVDIRASEFIRLLLAPFIQQAANFDVLTTTFNSSNIANRNVYVQLLTTSAKHSRSTNANFLEYPLYVGWGKFGKGEDRFIRKRFFHCSYLANDARQVYP